MKRLAPIEIFIILMIVGVIALAAWGVSNSAKFKRACHASGGTVERVNCQTSMICNHYDKYTTTCTPSTTCDEICTIKGREIEPEEKK